MIYRFILFACILAIIIGSVTACSSIPPTSTSSTTTTTDETASIRAYADPATQTTLEGLSENDLAKYTQFADAQFKAALTQEVFDKTSALLKNQLGDFVTIIFLSTEKQDTYTIVHYQAKYTKGEAGVRMVLNQDHLISGQWFE